MAVASTTRKLIGFEDLRVGQKDPAKKIGPWLMDFGNESIVMYVRMILSMSIMVPVFMTAIACELHAGFASMLAVLLGSIPVTRPIAVWRFIRNETTRRGFMPLIIVIVVGWYCGIQMTNNGHLEFGTGTFGLKIAPHLFGDAVVPALETMSRPAPQHNVTTLVDAPMQGAQPVAVKPGDSAIPQFPLTVRVMPQRAPAPQSILVIGGHAPSASQACVSGAVVWNWPDTHPRPALSANPGFDLVHANSVSSDRIQRTLAYWGSPMATESYWAFGVVKKASNYIYDLGVCHGVDAAVAMGFFLQESHFGIWGMARTTLSPGNIRPSSALGYRAFPNWAAGADALFAELRMYSKWGWTPVSVATPHWAPWGDGDNNPVEYAYNVEQAVNRLHDNKIAGTLN